MGNTCATHPNGKRVAGRCAECQRERNKRYYAAHSSEIKAQSAQWYASNKPRAIETARQWHAANPEKVRESLRLWKLRNVDRVHVESRAYALRWVKENYERKLVANARRRAAKRGATAALDAISRARYQELYDIARARTLQTGIEHHVDHDKPLALGGTDHPDNMRVIPASINLAKGARHPSTLAFLLS